MGVLFFRVAVCFAAVFGLVNSSYATYDNGVALYEAYRLNHSVDDDNIKDYYLKPYQFSMIHAPATFPVRYDADLSLGLVVTQTRVYLCSASDNPQPVVNACQSNIDNLTLIRTFKGNFVAGGDLDLLIADGNNSVVVTNTARDEGNMFVKPLPEEYNIPSNITAADVDGDGITDIVLNSGTSNQLALSWNGSLRSWQSYVGNTPSNRNYVPGAIQGSFATQAGVATYNIPFALPEGRGGFKPNLGIAYSSDAGNGTMGIGWNITGQSAISRCGLDIMRDGRIDGVDLDSNDKLCLNGTRMVLVSGTYGAKDSVYRLEDNSIVQITQKGAGWGNRYSWFIVRYKNGSEDHFGGEAFSKQVGTNKVPIAWLIKKKHESRATNINNRNSIEFHYDNTVDKRLKHIAYRGGFVKYHYGNIEQPRETESYVLGTLFDKRPLLSKVTIYNTGNDSFVTEPTGNLYREYSFNYKLNPSSRAYQLSQVSSCTENSSCLKETVLGWNRDNSSGFEHKTKDLNVNMGANRSVKPIDIDSDGKQELLVNNNDTNYIKIYNDLGEEVYNILKSNKNSQVHVVEFNGDAYPDILMSRGFDGQYRFDTVYLGTGNGDFKVKRLTNYFQVATKTKDDQLGDFNGDGLTDYYDFDLKRFYYNQSQDNGVDGFKWKLTSKNGFLDGSIRVVDINADGIDDVWFANNDTFHYMLMGSDFTYKTVNTGIWIGSTYEAYKKLQFADVNSDGLPDVISTINTNKLRLYINRGSDDIYGEFTRPGKWTKDRRRFDVRDFSSISWNSGIMMVDLNGDSIQDIFYSTPSNNKLYARYGTGDISNPFSDKVFYMNAWHLTSIGSYNNYVDNWFKTFADLDGDGDAEIISRGGTGYGYNLYAHYNQSTTTNDYLKEITDGMGVATKITYDVHTRSQFGTKEYPRPVADDDLAPETDSFVQLVPGPKSVVVKTETSNGIGGLIKTFYRYGDYYAHQHGLPIGFDKIETKSFALNNNADVDEGNLNVVHYSLNYANHTAGMPVTAIDWVVHSHNFDRVNAQDELEKINLDWFPVSYSRPTYDTRLFASDNQLVSAGNVSIWDQDENVNYRYQVVTTSREQVTYHLSKDVGESYGSDEQTIKIESFETDVWGNNTSADAQILSAPKDDGSYDVFITRTENEYNYDDPDSWFLGKLSKATVSKIVSLSGDTQPELTRTSMWTYNGVRHGSAPGAVASETINPGDVDNEVRTEYTYNAAGLKECTTITAANQHTVSNADNRSCTYYEPTFRYVKSVSNALSHSTTNIDYHPVHGGIEKVEDANGNWSLSEFDNFGRLVRKEDMLGNVTDIKMEFCNGACPDEPRAKYRIHTSSTGAPDSWEYYDVLNRVVRNVTLNFNGNYVHTKVQYDALGRKVREYEPFYKHNEPTAKFSETTNYDANGRPTRMVAANGAIKVIEYKKHGVKETTSYDTASSETVGLTAESINSEKRKKVYETQVYADGSTQWVKEQGSNNYTIHYKYDSMGNMTHMTDAAGNVTRIWYDIAGNKIKMDDPDKGIWQYVYDGTGRLIAQQDAMGNNTCMKYDILGRMRYRWDTCYPSASIDALAASAKAGFVGLDNATSSAAWLYDTSKLGLVDSVSGTSQGQTYTKTFAYDNFARVTDVTESMLGKQYVTSTKYYQEGSIHAGKVAQMTYPRYDQSLARFTVQNNYNALGFLSSIQQIKADNSRGKVYWKLKTVNERGQPVNESFSDNVFSQGKKYSNSTSLMTQMTTQKSGINWGNPSQNTIIKLNYQIDEQGNIRQREEKGHNHHLTETYKYDHLQRLRYADYKNHSTNVTGRQEVRYDKLGNITFKTGVGHYRYGANCETTAKGPHAVCETVKGGAITQYEYDENGSMVRREGREIRYTAFGKPQYIEGKNGTYTEFTYGPDHTRIHRQDKTAIGIRKTTYASGGAYEYIEKETAGEVEERISVGGFLSITYEAGDDEVSKEHYLVKDHLGSVIAVVNPLGRVVERMSFDAWGKRRTYASWRALTAQEELKYAQFKKPLSAEFGTESAPDGEQTTTRGFTGHEMVDTVGLIHMNGRMYDANLGRFISADPHIQSPTSTGSLNRYSYVMNNPVSYTDPSGYFFKKLFKAFKKLVNKVVSAWKSSWRSVGNFFEKIGKELKRALNHEVFGSLIRIVANFACLATGVGAIACAGLVAGGLTFIATGDLGMAIQAGVFAAVQAGFSQGIGDHFGHETGTFLTELKRGGAHGVLGAVMSVARGGKASAGFVSGFAGSAAGSLSIKGDNLTAGELFKNTMVSAAVGGTASELSGGKFANGALNSGYTMLYNHIIIYLGTIAVAEWKLSNDIGKRPGKRGPPGKSKELDSEQKAMTDMLNTDTLGGRKPLPRSEAEAYKDLAKEKGYDFRDDSGKAHWPKNADVKQDHMHIKSINLKKTGKHIPIENEVK